MISECNARKFCCEDISLIENYELAVNDKTQTWQCHHRLECVNGVYTSRDELKQLRLYWKRPANELIFLTRAEHFKIHNNDPTTKKKNSVANKGENNGMFGKHLSEETKIKISKANNGKTPWNKGKPRSLEEKIKISEAIKGSHWWNNGLICKYCKDRPGPNFVLGRIKNKGAL